MPRLVIPFLSLLLFCGGCASTKGPPAGTVPSERQLAAWMRQAKDPSIHWIRMGMDDNNEIIYANANRVHGGKYIELPFASLGALPFPACDQAGADGKKQRILFDTSSQHSWSDFSTALALEAKPLAIRSVQVVPRHVKDVRSSARSVASVLRLGHGRVDSAVLNVRPVYGTLGPLARGVKRGKWTPNMVIGNELLAQFQTVHFDFPRKRLVLSSSTPYTVEPDSGAVSVPMKIYKGATTIPVSINGTPRRGAIIDTAGSYSLAVPRPIGRSASLQIGDLLFDDVPVVSTASHGLGVPGVPRIGLHLLQRYRVTFEHADATEGGDADWRMILEEPYLPESSGGLSARNVFKRRGTTPAAAGEAP